ncbi:plant adhesion molecule 1 [Thecamonas trahens ATCC 50062]|uniref:Plant adhesion molecule 1 n=1 Tax=Thecamonas trahens ATCC 50062 TaxID=461836 RepID=A0A0L0DCR4_THETB|nr:plant adhesion molecule 1 [Thecamonas trahens ATCC 50062]KNC49911.1 plant adhesion molecule 1 [Thecamonas trahens ATCC 50062]|eukprot:XP_013757392.1 plant adhesion molecule 1 [Thecamonas trahens ATCC 50062]
MSATGRPVVRRRRKHGPIVHTRRKGSNPSPSPSPGSSAPPSSSSRLVALSPGTGSSDSSALRPTATTPSGTRYRPPVFLYASSAVAASGSPLDPQAASVVHPSATVAVADALPSHSFSYRAADGLGRVEVEIARGGGGGGGGGGGDGGVSYHGSELDAVIAAAAAGHGSDSGTSVLDDSESGKAHVEAEGGLGASDGAATAAPVAVDRFGFVLASPGDERSVGGRPASRPLDQASKDKESERATKWLTMFRDWRRWRVKPKTKARVRKGIPDCVRGQAWLLASGGHEWLLRQDRSPVERFLQRATDAWAQTIRLDINRTFPDHLLFMQADGLGQSTLHRVLLAFSAYDPAVGYCQGMAFVAALLLMYMAEEEAFAVLVSIAQDRPRFGFAGFWAPGFPLLNKYFTVFSALLADVEPKLAQHLIETDVHPSLYTTGWFMTLFTNSDLPFAYSLRVMDMVLYEGEKALLRWALAFMVYYKEELLKGGNEVVFPVLKGLQGLPANPNVFVKGWVLKVDITHAQIDAHAGAYDAAAAAADGET